MTAAGDDEALGRGLAALAANLGPLLAPTSFEALLNSITEVARRLFDAAACSIALIDEEAEELIFYVTAGAGAEEVLGIRVPMGQGIAGYVATTGQAIAIEDVTADPRFARDVAESTGYVPRSILATPLDTGEGTIGVLEVLDRDESNGGSGDLELLSLFAHQAALAIESSKVFADLGRVLFTAAARVTKDKPLHDALVDIAESAPSPDADLAELAACFAALSELGERERATATRLLSDFTQYARSRRPR